VVSSPNDQARVADNVKHVLDAARNAIDGEFARAERFDAKARGQATLAGSWFAVSQAVAAASIDSHTARCWIIALLIALAVQAVALCMLLRASAKVWGLKERDAVGTSSLNAMLVDTIAAPQDFGAKAVEFYGTILTSARAANADRAKHFGADKGCARLLSATFWWWPVLFAGLAEMAIGLASRLA
jgi:hypothetical protein